MSQAQVSEAISTGITAHVAAFVHDTRWEDIPSVMRHEAKRSLVNYFAVAYAGCHDPVLDKALAVYQRFSAPATAGVVGRTERLDMLQAAALNAMAANVFDYDDTHLPTIIHPTAPIAAALFALAESEAIAGPQFLLAFVLGVEVACRLGNAVSPEHYQRGWHITSTCCVFGAAAAVAKIRGLRTDQIEWALGNAAVQAGGLVEALGTMSKSISVGNAARNGLLAAFLAEADFSGPKAPIEGRYGFMRATTNSIHPEQLTEGLGTQWALASNTYKPYPCGVVLNPVIEACLALRKDAAWSFDEIESATLAGHPLLRERTDRPGVRTGRESQVSAQHAVAAVLLKGTAGLEVFSDACVAEPVVRAFGGKLRFVDEPNRTVDSASVSVTLRDGAVHAVDIERARGSLGFPLTDDDLSQKLRTLRAYDRDRPRLRSGEARGAAAAATSSGVAAAPPDPAAEALLEALWRMESLTDAAQVMKLAGGVS